jgi:NAD(P)H-flavin reductase
MKTNNSQHKSFRLKNRFRFWQFGQWVEVYVDDRLPVCRGRPIGICCADPTLGDFWPSLLEKAYAKYEICNLIFLLCDSYT